MTERKLLTKYRREVLAQYLLRLK